jgi:hypothetical protein
MIKVAHRINTSEALNLVPNDCGVELDLRSINSEIVLGHDFPARGEEFSHFLGKYNHKLLILNVKEDGLEESIIEILSTRKDIEYFFLDQPFPTIIKSSKAGFATSIRVSEFEDLPKIPTGAKWIWIDSFTGDWNHVEPALEYARANKIRTCLVAPELQGRFDQIETDWLIAEFKGRLDAVCTKNLLTWE